jgi:alkylhydroperoxidase/carboxymuconolactone decarboxylase family protein YurZ
MRKAAPKKSAVKKPAPRKSDVKPVARSSAAGRRAAPKPRAAARTPAAPARRGRAGSSRPAAGKGLLDLRVDQRKPPTNSALSPKLTGEKYRAALREAVRDSGLPRRIAHGVVLSVLLGDSRIEQLREQLDWALEERVPAYYLAESFLQSYLFIGYPRTLNALGILHDVNRSRRRSLGLAADPLNVPSEVPSLDRILGGPSEFGPSLKGRRIRLAEGPPMHLEAPGEGPGSFERYAREWWRRGTDLCRVIYGTQFNHLRETLGRIHHELADWMIFEGYGKVLARPVITPRERELWILPLLLVQNVPDQFYSHLRGALNLEVPSTRLRAAFWVAAAVVGPEGFRYAISQLEELEERSDSRLESGPYR